MDEKNDPCPLCGQYTMPLWDKFAVARMCQNEDCNYIEVRIEIESNHPISV